MDYISYLKDKLNLNDFEDITEYSVKYLGKNYPKRIQGYKEFEIVDSWFKDILDTWNVELRTLNLSQSNFLGLLEPKQNGFILNLNKNLFTTIKRFTLAHEIAHILSFDTTSVWPERKVVHSKTEELFCNKIARSMLLPSTLFNFDFLNLNEINDEQVRAIVTLWKEFQISPWQIILKLNDNSDLNKIYIFWKYYEAESCLRIYDHCQPKNIFIPQNDRVFLSHLLSKKRTNAAPALAFNEDKLYQGYDLIEIGSFYKKRLFTSAFPIKTKSAKYVIQIIHL